MIVVFNGIIEKKSGGCAPCGTKRASKQSMAMSKSYILPSGVNIRFLAGRKTEVLDSDGEFLLSYTYKDKEGKTQNVFTKVE